MHKQVKPKSFYYGFPVILLTTIDEHGKTNITPISSSFCLGDNIIVGLSLGGKALENLRKTPEAVLNLASVALWEKVESLAQFTGRESAKGSDKVPFYCENKFIQGGFTAQASDLVKPARILEAPIQAEVKLVNINERENFGILEFKIQKIHAEEALIKDGDQIDYSQWQPLIYNFRYYQGVTEAKGKNFKA